MNVLGTFPLAYLRDTVANVNGSVTPRVSALDALYVKLRTVGSINSYPAGDWKVGDTTVAFAGSALNVNLKALCVGDVNGSHVPGALKQAPGLNILQQGIIAARVDEPFTYEVKSLTAAEPGAMTLFLNFDDKLFEVTEVVSDLQELKYTIENGRIALAWADTRPLNLDANQTIFSFTVRAKAQISQPQAIFTIAQGSEFADVNANPISEFDLRMADVFTPAISGEISLMNYPNPFKNNTQVVFTIPEQGHVKLVMTNLFGQQIRTLAEGNMTAGTHSVMVDPSDNNLPSGVYLCKIILTNYDQTQSKMVKML